MNHSLRRLAIGNKSVLTMVNAFYNLKNRRKFSQLINVNEKRSIFDYSTLAQAIPYAPSDLVIDNNLYGLSYTLKQYAGIDVTRSLDATIEHGVFFGNLVRQDDRIYPVKSIVTYGHRRVAHLQQGAINKEIIPIGPYIHYASSLFSVEDFMELKKRLGKVLLVFPSHAIIGISTGYNLKNFIAEIERVRKEFDTVLISLYWLDALNTQLVSMYEEHGYTVVTSGHRFDLNFLSRQRSIIELADYTMSNSSGTHVGYCIHLNKPHYIFRQKIDYLYQNKSAEKHIISSRTNDNELSRQKELEEVCSFFDVDLRTITPEHKAVVEEFWGTSFIKTPEELRASLPVI